MSPAAVQDDDARLVNLCRAGDRVAFDRIVLKYQHLMVSMCTRLLNSRQDGEDAAQECFVKVYRQITRFKGESSFSTWLYRIAVNTCRNHHRSWRQRLSKRSISLDAPRSANNDEDPVPVDFGDTRFTPVKELEQKRLGAAILKALNELPRQQREMVVLRDLQGLSYEEIERSTGQAEVTVKSRLFRARSVLQEKLKDLKPGPTENCSNCFRSISTDDLTRRPAAKLNGVSNNRRSCALRWIPRNCTSAPSRRSNR